MKEYFCIINETSSTQQGVPFQAWKLFGVDIKKMGVWSIVLCQDFVKVIPMAKLGSHSHGNMKQSDIFGVT